MKAANPNAVWTLMGWIFVNDPNVWTPAHTAALFNEVPNDKLLLLDMAVDAFARTSFRHTWNWNRFSGFYGKRWVWSTIPNFGGLTLLTGNLAFYANGHLAALASPDRGNLFAYGTMPEGMEQNDVVYELISCAGWSDRPIDVDAWLANYSRSSGWCARRAKMARRRTSRPFAAHGSTVVCRSRRPFRAGQARSWPTKPCGWAAVSSGKWLLVKPSQTESR